jgi:hypothetical protein
MGVELTQTEHAFLVTLLQERQRELLLEIARADHHEFRRRLQQREKVLETLLGKLAAGGSSPAAA